MTAPLDDADLAHEKHLQLGADPSNDDRAEVEDHDAVWADACTVDEFKAQLEELAVEDPSTLAELAALRAGA